MSFLVVNCQQERFFAVHVRPRFWRKSRRREKASPLVYQRWGQISLLTDGKRLTKGQLLNRADQ